MGKTVNTSANETFPIIDPKHKFLIFESNKLKSKGRIQLNGQLNKDLYIYPDLMALHLPLQDHLKN